MTPEDRFLNFIKISWKKAVMQALINLELFNKNSFDAPENIVPEEKSIRGSKDKATVSLPAYPVNILKMRIN